MSQITPFLWFDSQLGDAIELYTSVFPNSKVISEERTPEGAPGGRPGALFTAEFELNGQRFRGLNAGPHDPFNDAVSFYVHCENQDEVDYYWDALLADGGTPSRCGWLNDRFGVRWQIIPRQLGELLSHSERGQRAMQVMLGQQKIVIAELENA